jgi:RimJ/RimL family protein N-acetyltransferase
MESDPSSARWNDDDSTEPDPSEWSKQTVLRDGTRVLLRQIRPDDRDRLAEGLRRLSSASRYLRFHTDIEEFTEEQLDYLTKVDHVDHEAIVALDLDRPDVPGIGVARYIRHPFEREVAEAAITVADEYHGQGAGTILLGALASRARKHGVRVFRNYVLAHNQAMLEVFDQLGAHRELETPALWRVDLALPDHESDLPDSAAGRAFMEAARNGFRLSSLFPPVWSRRRRAGDRDEPAGGYSDGIEAELTSLRGELDQWLSDRERRALGWPSTDVDESSEDGDEPGGGAEAGG